MLNIIFLLSVALTIYLVAAIVNGMVRFIGHCVIMAGGKISKVEGMKPAPFYLLPFPATYVVWYLLTF